MLCKLAGSNPFPDLCLLTIFQKNPITYQLARRTEWRNLIWEKRVRTIIIQTVIATQGKLETTFTTIVERTRHYYTNNKETSTCVNHDSNNNQLTTDHSHSTTRTDHSPITQPTDSQVSTDRTWTNQHSKTNKLPPLQPITTRLSESNSPSQNRETTALMSSNWKSSWRSKSRKNSNYNKSSRKSRYKAKSSRKSTNTLSQGSRN